MSGDAAQWLEFHLGGLGWISVSINIRYETDDDSVFFGMGVVPPNWKEPRTHRVALGMSRAVRLPDGPEYSAAKRIAVSGASVERRATVFKEEAPAEAEREPAGASADEDKSLFVKSNPISYRVSMEAQLANLGGKTRWAAVIMPRYENGEYQHIREIAVPGEVKTMVDSEDTFFQSVVELDPGEKKTVRYEFDVTFHDLRADFSRIGELRPHDRTASTAKSSALCGAWKTTNRSESPSRCNKAV